MSKGPADRPVPDVVGKTIAEASNLLGQAGFTVEPDAPRRPSTVDGGPRHPHRPARRHACSPKGAAVTVVVSTGPAESAVPSVDRPHRGQRHQHASTAPASRAVVEEDATDDPTEDGRVVDQDPDGNTDAPNGLAR